MEITVSRLRRIMDLTRGAIGKDAAQFVLCKDGFAVSNNLELAIAVELPELGNESFLLPHKNLRDTLQYLPGNSLLEVVSEQNRVTLKALDSKFSTTLHTSAVEDFPDFPVIERTGGGEVDGDALVGNITELLGYASKEKARPVLTGVCLTLGDALEVAAADGFRLAWRTLPIKLIATETQPPRVIVPADAFKMLGRLWRRVDKRSRASNSFGVERLTTNPQLQVASMATARRYIEIAFGEFQVSFHLGEATLVSHTIDGEFPNYHSLIPEKATHSVVFDAGEAYRGLRQLAPIASGGSNIIRFRWSRDSLTLQAASAELGEAQASLTASIKGRASHIAFNLRYLLEILKDKDGPVLLETGLPTGPGRFTHYASPNILVMSMATSDTREADVASESAVDLDPEPEAAEHQRGGENDGNAES